MNLTTLDHLELVTENMEVIPVPAEAVKEFDYTIKDPGKENLIASSVHLVIDVAVLFKKLKENDSKATLYDVMFGNVELTREILDRLLVRNDIALIEHHTKKDTQVDFYPTWAEGEEFEETNPYQHSDLKGDVLVIHIEKETLI